MNDSAYPPDLLVSFSFDDHAIEVRLDDCRANPDQSSSEMEHNMSSYAHR